MKYLLDTNIIVDHLREKEILKAEILEEGGGISIITLGELLYGAYKSDHPQNTLTKLSNSLKILDIKVINLDKEIINEFAKIKAYLEKAGQRLEDFDLLIAATALINNFTLVTKNIKHFNRIKNLKLTN